METTWNGFACQKFLFEEHEAILVLPREEDNIRKLAVKTEYWGAFPKAAEIGLLNRGFTLCFIKNDNRWGVNDDLDRKARFIRYIQEKYGLSEKCVPVGMSCGGLIAIKLAARHPELISCLYLDAPVLNYMSCPCGFGIGNPLSEAMDEILSALKLNNISELLAYRDMPMDHLSELVQNRIPVVLVAGDSDVVVPYAENGILLEKAYRDTGIDLEIYIKPGCDHHPHGLEDNEPVIEFIMKHSAS